MTPRVRVSSCEHLGTETHSLRKSLINSLTGSQLLAYTVIQRLLSFIPLFTSCHSEGVFQITLQQDKLEAAERTTLLQGRNGQGGCFPLVESAGMTAGTPAFQ